VASGSVPNNCYLGDEIQKKEMGDAFGMHGGQERRMWGVEGRNLLERPEGRSKHRRECNIKKELQEIAWGVEWIDLAVDADRGRALVNLAMNG
jgi:hypothetical protein